MDDNEGTPPPDAGDATSPPAGGGDEDATRVLPAAGDATEDATRVLPAAGDADAAAPPPRPQPTLIMSRPPRQESSSTVWIVVLVIVLVLVAAAAAWYFLLRDKGSPAPTPTPTPTKSAAFAWEGAWGRTDGSGGGLVIQQDAGAYLVTVYDTMVQVIGTATATESGEDLAFGLETQQGLAGIPGPYSVTLSPGASADAITMSAAGASGTTITAPLKRVTVLVPVTPGSSPTSSPTPTASPSTSPTVSPSASPSPSSTDAGDQVKAGIDRIRIGVITWAANNNDLYPEPADVTQTGAIATYVDPWPTNPYTGAPMKPGTAPGEYTYQQIDGGAGYQLTGYLADGFTYTVR